VYRGCPGNCPRFSFRPHLPRFPLALSLLFFGFSLEEGSWAHRVDCAGGFGVQQRSPLLISSPPECLSLLAKSMPISFRPHLSISPRSSSSVCLSGAIGRSGGVIAPGSSGAATQPPSVSSPSGWLSLLAKTLPNLLPAAPLDSPRFSSSVCLSEAIGRTGVDCAGVFGCCDAALFGQFPIRVASRSSAPPHIAPLALSAPSDATWMFALHLQWSLQ
jgi:hypothetical protein